MQLDASTLFVVLIGMSAMTSVALGSRWIRHRADVHLLCWSIGFLMACVAITCLSLRGIIPDFVSIVVANTLALGAFGFGWNGVRLFDGRRAHWWFALVLPAVWLAACAVPDIYESFARRTFVMSMLTAVASAMLADAIWRQPPDRLAARGPMAVLCLLHSVAALARAVYAFLHQAPGAMEFSDHFTAFALLEPIFVLFGVTLLGLGMSQQRTEGVLLRRASTDSLTGLLNRGAFLERAEALIELARRENRVVALLVLDLDHFKEINDRYGHACGDRALARFAEVARDVLRPADPIGRIGGEEFAVLLVGMDGPAGAAVAERMRREFTRRAIEVEGRHVVVTMSVGIAATRHEQLDALMARGDAALYAAKRGGRDVVREAAE